MGALRNSVPNLVEMPDRRAFDVQQAVRRTALGNASAKSVLQVLAAAVDAKGWCFMNTESVLAESDVDLRTLQKIKQVFAAMGLLTHVRLSRSEMASLRQRGGTGAYREEEWQLKLELLGRDLSSAYAELLSRFNGKSDRPLARTRLKPGPISAAAADAAGTLGSAAAAEFRAAAASPSDSLLGKNSKEHQGTSSCTRGEPASVDTKTLSAATALVCSTLGWRGPWAVREIYPACAEALESLCSGSNRSIPEASDLVMKAWRFEQESADPAKSVPWWFGSGRWLACIDRVRVPRLKPAAPARRRWTRDEYNELQQRLGRKPVSAEEYESWPEQFWAWIDIEPVIEPPNGREVNVHHVESAYA